MPVDPLALLLAAAVTFCAAIVQGTVGIGFAVVSVPILSLIDPVLAPVPQLLITVPMTATMAWRERAHLDLRGVGWILAGRIPGALLGLALLLAATDRTLDAFIAITVLAAVAVIGSGVRVRRTRTTKFGAGVVSGASGLVASIGGPPLALLYRDETGSTIRSSLASVFLIGVTISILARGLAGEIVATDLQAAVWLVVPMGLGLWASTRLAGRVEGPPLRVAILIVSALAGAALLVRAVLG